LCQEYNIIKGISPALPDIAYKTFNHEIRNSILIPKKEDTMKRSLLIFSSLIIISLLSGCILSKTPKTKNVNIPLGKPMTFSVKIFPFNATYAWTLNGTPLSNSGNSYVYIAEKGDYLLTVKAKHTCGTDTQTWHITCNPITDLLNSMISIPEGTFMMGNTDDTHGQAQFTKPVHEVNLQGFQIGAYEVTQAQFLEVMSSNPSYFQEVNGYLDTGNNPVEYVTWFEAKEFCTKLSAMTGRTFTLPSEAQWEYACRAGTTTLYSFGDDDALLGDYAWYLENSENQTHPVGTKSPNPWGLYDMHGNVEEWCLDLWHENYEGAPTDGSAWGEPVTGSDQGVTRGGSWSGLDPWFCWSAIRYYPTADFWSNHFGFRVVAIP
jgi:formylglycine-generating enzyme required for sulfatase activity